MKQKNTQELVQQVKKTLKQRYDKAVVKRQPYLDRAREAAKFTIPSLIPPEANTSSTTYEEPNQSIGADGINNLSAKLTLTMLPPNTPFFKFSGDGVKLRQEVEDQGGDPDEEEAAQNDALSKLEQYIKDKVEADGDRIVLGEAVKHLLVGGNTFFVDDKDDGLKHYPLSRYVVKRDYSGNVLFAITTENIAYEVLPEFIQAVLNNKISDTQDAEDKEHKEYTLYTCFERNDNKWQVWQEVEGYKIPESEGTYPIDKCPFIALRYTRIDGEDYGRGLIEEYIGDLRYIDVASKAIKELSLGAAGLKILVDPAGITKAEKLKKTPNGGFCVGGEQDVHVLQTNKNSDLNTIETVTTKVEKRLNRIFLLSQSVTRDAERVTAEEIQYMVKDLEEALGNLYSILSKEFQKPYLIIKYHHLKQTNKKLPDIFKDKNINLTITTGIESLGRSNELQKWSTLIKFMTEAQVIVQMGGDASKIMDVCAASLGLDVKGIMPTKEQIAQQQQQTQQAELMKQATPGLVNQIGGAVQNVQKSMLNEGEKTNG
jgi:hypothetical protein